MKCKGKRGRKTFKNSYSKALQCLPVIEGIKDLLKAFLAIEEPWNVFKNVTNYSQHERALEVIPDIKKLLDDSKELWKALKGTCQCFLLWDICVRSLSHEIK